MLSMSSVSLEVVIVCCVHFCQFVFPNGGEVEEIHFYVDLNPIISVDNTIQTTKLYTTKI